jgi:uncharacterized protein (TIGR03435 family)
MKRTNSLTLFLLSFLCAAQAQNTAPRAAFDAASVKIADRKFIRGVSGKMKGGPGTSDPGRIVYTQVFLDEILAKACNTEAYRIFAPDWLAQRGADLYTIKATMPPETTKPQFQLMLQNLLIERFQIKFHHETRMFPGYRLIIAPGGPKLRESADPDEPDPPNGDTGQLDADGFLVLPPGHGEGISVGSDGVRAKFQDYTTAEFAGSQLKGFLDQLSGQFRTHVMDSTGLAGKYDFKLKFDNHADAATASVVGAGVRSNVAPDGGSVNSAGVGLPNIFKAVEQQLGLRLVKINGIPLDAIVVDHIEKVPIEN